MCRCHFVFFRMTGAVPQQQDASYYCTVAISSELVGSCKRLQVQSFICRNREEEVQGCLEGCMEGCMEGCTEGRTGM